ncbi:thiolase-like protein [Scenedesmus sp. NREL 46B-D3]|nr:thiolase-like protein [Scenedesmus sp. NREL 46B-D3]
MFSGSLEVNPQALPQRRVVVTGIGMVSPLGVGVSSSWSQLVEGRTAVRRLQEEDLPESHRPYMQQLPCQVVAAVPRAAAGAAAAAAGVDTRRSSPFISFAQIAAAEALQDAGWQPRTAADQAATGVAIGAGMSCTSEISDAGALIAAGKLRRVTPYFVPRILVNMAAGAVGIAHRLRGPNHAVSTACATGVHCIGDGFRMVQRGDATLMLAGATEACIDAISLGGFCRLKALSTGFNDAPGRASRPFDAARDGFVMGEGAAVLLLEELEHARSRGVRMYAEVRGYGLSGDGHHITAPHPAGAGAALAMRRALHGSGVPAGSICYINAHATSTPVGDEIEQAAILDVFGPEQVRNIHVSSTKGATGHLLGAAGAVEAAFTILALQHRLAPPTCNLERPDPQLLPLLVTGAAAELPDGPRAVLCNSFGFGGTNASVLFSSPPAAA